MFTKVVDSDAGCFWQENTMLGSFGAGMGISTWWYRGSDMDTERTLEQQAGRTLTELSVDGNKGFKAFDANACSIYVSKGGDVITWSIQTMNPATPARSVRHHREARPAQSGPCQLSRRKLEVLVFAYDSPDRRLNRPVDDRPS